MIVSDASFESSFKRVEQDILADLTNTQKALAFYYAMLALEVKPRATVHLTSMAKCMHLFFDKPHKDMQNSDLYRRLRSIAPPSYSSTLRRDLARIKPFFLRVAWKEPLQLIESDLLDISDTM